MDGWLDVGKITSGDEVMGFVMDNSVTPREWYYSPKTAESVDRFSEYRDVRIVPVWYFHL